MKPLRNLVLLKPLPLPTQTPTGLFLPQGANQSSEDREGITYRVEAVGDGYHTKKGQLVPPEVKPGDRVWLDKASEFFPARQDDGTLLVDARAIAMVLP